MSDQSRLEGYEQGESPLTQWAMRKAWANPNVPVKLDRTTYVVRNGIDLIKVSAHYGVSAGQRWQAEEWRGEWINPPVAEYQDAMRPYRKVAE